MYPPKTMTRKKRLFPATWRVRSDFQIEAGQAAPKHTSMAISKTLTTGLRCNDARWDAFNPVRGLLCSREGKSGGPRQAHGVSNAGLHGLIVRYLSPEWHAGTPCQFPHRPAVGPHHVGDDPGS